MPDRNQSVLDYFANRQSVPLTMITGPGPDEKQLAQLLTLASRTPDHGRLEPWRFIIYRDAHGAIIGEHLQALARKRRPGLAESEYERDANRLRRAPVAIGVVFTPKKHDTIPDWEQFLCAGAVAMNLVHAATASGFAANWITGWYSDDPDGRAILGLMKEERMAGIVHIGNCDKEPAQRPRPNAAALTSEYAGPQDTN